MMDGEKKLIREDVPNAQAKCRNCRGEEKTKEERKREDAKLIDWSNRVGVCVFQP